MAAASSFGRPLLALACFALLVATCAVRHKHRKSHKCHEEHFDNSALPNCAVYKGGRITKDVVVLDRILTPPYKAPYTIESIDHCKLKNQKMVGHMIEACDPFGPPGPSIKVYSKLVREVKCYTDGPCPSGLTVKISQYCSAITSN